MKTAAEIKEMGLKLVAEAKRLEVSNPKAAQQYQHRAIAIAWVLELGSVKDLIFTKQQLATLEGFY